MVKSGTTDDYVSIPFTVKKRKEREVYYYLTTVFGCTLIAIIYGSIYNTFICYRDMDYIRDDVLKNNVVPDFIKEFLFSRRNNRVLWIVSAAIINRFFFGLVYGTLFWIIGRAFEFIPVKCRDLFYMAILYMIFTALLFAANVDLESLPKSPDNTKTDLMSFSDYIGYLKNNITNFLEKTTKNDKRMKYLAVDNLHNNCFAKAFPIMIIIILLYRWYLNTKDKRY